MRFRLFSSVGQCRVLATLVLALAWNPLLGADDAEPAVPPPLPDITITIGSHGQGEPAAGDEASAADQAEDPEVGQDEQPNAEFLAAERELLVTITNIEETGNALSSELIEPLESLAELYADNGDYVRSGEALKRARHLTHREYGLMSLRQIELADRLTDVYLAQGEIRNANREQRLNYRVAEFNYGADNPRMVPVFEKLGAYYRRTAQWNAARENYRRALALVERHYGGTDMRLVPPLRGIADSYREQGEMSKRGLEALERVRAVHEQQEFVDSQERAAALAELGDSYLLYGQDGRATASYRDAWNLLAAEGETPEVANQFFAKPKKLSVEFIPSGSGSGVVLYPIETTAKLKDGEVFVLVGFTVRPDGRTQGVQVLESNAPIDLQREVRLAVRTARFRPRFVDGQAIRSDPIKLRERFVLGN